MRIYRQTDRQLYSSLWEVPSGKHKAGRCEELLQQERNSRMAKMSTVKKKETKREAVKSERDCVNELCREKERVRGEREQHKRVGLA